MRVGIAADHGGFILKGEVAEFLRSKGYEVEDLVHTKWILRMTIPTLSYHWHGQSPRTMLSAAWRFAEAVWERPSLPTKCSVSAPA